VLGDALARRYYKYDRRAIIALSCNDSPGPMYGKKGLPYELGRVEEIWKSDGHFALMHDLTNCLRIADLSEIVSDGMTWLREIKAQATHRPTPDGSGAAGHRCRDLRWSIARLACPLRRA
jgi:hypothetical protein